MVISKVERNKAERFILNKSSWSIMKMNDDKFKASKEWYMSAVEGCLILRGMTKDQARKLMKEYRLEERIDAFPDLQMHYDVEVTADEIVASA